MAFVEVGSHVGDLANASEPVAVVRLALENEGGAREFHASRLVETGLLHETLGASFVNSAVKADPESAEAFVNLDCFVSGRVLLRHLKDIYD